MSLAELRRIWHEAELIDACRAPGHVPWLEVPAEFGQHLLEFLGTP